MRSRTNTDAGTKGKKKESKGKEIFTLSRNKNADSATIWLDKNGEDRRGNWVLSDGFMKSHNKVVSMHPFLIPSCDVIEMPHLVFSDPKP